MSNPHSHIPFRKYPARPAMKPARDLIVENIRGLLEVQQKNQGALAFACGKERSWINKILNGRRGLDVAELNAIADFFHIETYQLLQPGIARRTERRSGHDRRTGTDRREAEAVKIVKKLKAGLTLRHGERDAPPATTEEIIGELARAAIELGRRHNDRPTAADVRPPVNPVTGNLPHTARDRRARDPRSVK